MSYSWPESGYGEDGRDVGAVKVHCHHRNCDGKVTLWQSGRKEIDSENLAGCDKMVLCPFASDIGTVYAEDGRAVRPEKIHCDHGNCDGVVTVWESNRRTISCEKSLDCDKAIVCPYTLDEE